MVSYIQPRASVGVWVGLHAAPNGAWLISGGAFAINMALLTELAPPLDGQAHLCRP